MTVQISERVFYLLSVETGISMGCIPIICVVTNILIAIASSLSHFFFALLKTDLARLHAYGD